MALDLVGGSLFTLLYDGVKEAMVKTTQFKTLLADLKSTLDSLQPRIIEQIGEHNTELGLRNDEIEDLQRQMEEGVKLVEKFSEFRVWNYCCVGDSTDQLIELDRALRRLLDMLRLQEARDVKETLLLSRQNRDKLDEVNRRLIEIQKLLVQQQQLAGGMTEATDSGNNTEAVPEPIQGNGIQVAALDGEDAVEVVFGMLFDAVLEVEDKAVMFKTPLGDLKSTLFSLKPLIEEISQRNKVLVRPKEELEKFTKEMEKGVELIPKCSEVHPGASYKKFTYTEKLIGLENFLQRQLYILKRQVARDVRDTLVSIRRIEMVIEQIEKSGALQIQVQSEGCSEVAETLRPSVGLDVVNVQGTRDVEETMSSMKNTEPAVKPTEGSGIVQNQLEKPSPPTVGLDVGNVQRTRVVEETMSPIQYTEAEVQPNEESGVIQNQLETKGTKNAPKDYTLLSRIYKAFSRNMGLNTSSGAETSLFSEEKTSTFRSKHDDQSFQGNQAERFHQEFRNTDSYTTSVAGSSLFSEGETSTFRSRDDDQSIDGHIPLTSNLRDFKFAELKIATRNFSPDVMIGEGGFGRVFKGWLDKTTLSPSKPGTGMVVAIKKLKPEILQGRNEWVTEVNVLGLVVEHPNLVKLVGYCAEDDEIGIQQRLLIYEYMPNGSVESHLSNRSDTPLPWAMRLNIAQDAARGLTCLHEEMHFQIIFRDFKSSNILLDKEWNAKLSDFGMARLGPDEGVHHVPTAGYAAPEYIQTGRLTSKTDVWSYGVFLYELITGRRPLDRDRPKSEQKLLEWVKPYISDLKKFRFIIDPRLEGKYPLKSVQKLAIVANRCLVRLPKNRPKMSEVLEMVNQIIETPSGQKRSKEASPGQNKLNEVPSSLNKIKEAGTNRYSYSAASLLPR